MPEAPKLPQPEPATKSKSHDRFLQRHRLGVVQKFLSKKEALFALVFVLLGVGIIYTTFASDPIYDRVGQLQLRDRPAQGISYKGLLKVKPNVNHPCTGEFQVENVQIDTLPVCSHGDDPYPKNLNQKARADQLKTAKASIALSDSTQKAGKNNKLAAPNTLVNDLVDETNTLPVYKTRCYGTGYDGKRVQLIYAHTITRSSADRSSIRYGFTLSAGRVETQMVMSSVWPGITGPVPTSKHIRFVTDSFCNPTVLDVTLPKLDHAYSGGEIMSKLASQGFKLSNRKYLVWFDGPTDVCGIASAYNTADPNPATNANNNNTGYGVIGPKCWNTTAELHELTHTLGAVSNSAPHSTGALHCRDEHDVMCYDDGGPSSKQYVSSACGSTNYKWFLDCNDDDYFTSSYARATDRTNWLYNHWNVASSSWLHSGD